jgi:hypothetical protein
MALLSVAIAVPLRMSATRLTRIHRRLTALVGAISCSLGLSVIWQAGILKDWLLLA